MSVRWSIPPLELHGLRSLVLRGQARRPDSASRSVARAVPNVVISCPTSASAFRRLNRRAAPDCSVIPCVGTSASHCRVATASEVALARTASWLPRSGTFGTMASSARSSDPSAPTLRVRDSRRAEKSSSLSSSCGVSAASNSPDSRRRSAATYRSRPQPICSARSSRAIAVGATSESGALISPASSAWRSRSAGRPSSSQASQRSSARPSRVRTKGTPRSIEVPMSSDWASASKATPYVSVSVVTISTSSHRSRSATTRRQTSRSSSDGVAAAKRSMVIASLGNGSAGRVTAPYSCSRRASAPGRPRAFRVGVMTTRPSRT